MTAPNAEPTAARLADAHGLAVDFYRDHLMRADGPRRYLSHRGLDHLIGAESDEATPWKVGYAPDAWTGLVDHLVAAGFQPTELLAAGLAIRTGRGRVVDLFRDRIMMPVHDSDGRPIAFIGRAAPNAASSKYLNTPDTGIYHKGQTLFGLGEQQGTIAAGASPVVVEGPFDVFAVALAFPKGEYVGLAPCGTRLTHHHATLIAATPGSTGRGVSIVFDNDRAGRDATVRAWQLFGGRHGLVMRFAALPHDCDPADLITRPEGLDALRAALTNATSLGEAAIDIVLNGLLARRPDLLRFPEGRLAAARTLAAVTIGQSADQVVALARYVARQTNVDVAAAVDAVIECLDRSPDAANASPRSAPFPPQRSLRPRPTSRDGPARQAGPGRSDQPNAQGRVQFRARR
jgi:DNA primase